MIKLLIKKFIEDSENINDANVRKKYGELSGILGICCNLLLFAAKLFAGLISGSIALISDAVNNLSDTASSAVTIIGAVLSAKRADRDHPYGHGRMEYISALTVSFIVILAGFELLQSSFSRFFSPEKVSLDTASAVIIIISVFVKLWMFSYNRYIAKKISSPVNEAAAADSISDVFATSAAGISAALGTFTDIPADGAAGMLVSVLIMRSGYESAKATVDLLLGKAPGKETVSKIKEIIMSYDDIIGMHDLAVHDYGPGRVMASVHAEVPDNSDLVYIHDVVTDAEERLGRELGITAVIHIDPVPVNDRRTDEAKNAALTAVKEINENYSIHDFSLRSKGSVMKIYFDLAVPCETSEKKRREDEEIIRKKLGELYGGCEIIIVTENE